jgi:hypothetical protein
MVLAAGPTGCDDSVATPRTFEFKDEGQLCLYPQGAQGGHPDLDRPTLSFEADSPLAIEVTFPICLSSSCSKDPTASCSVIMADASMLVVSSVGSVREEGNACTADCGFFVARCQSPALAAGTYTVRHGGDELRIAVPSMMRVPCIGGGR